MSAEADVLFALEIAVELLDTPDYKQDEEWEAKREAVIGTWNSYKTPPTEATHG